MLIKKIWNRCKRKIFKPNKHYTIDGFEIELSDNHMLAHYQETFCYYDRALPMLVKTLGSQKDDHWIIDIGANVGDTLFSLLKQSPSNILCIEPDREFYQLLEKNVASLPTNYQKQVQCLNTFVVLDTSKAIMLEKKLGTAHKVELNNTDISTSTASKKLKDIIIEQNINPKHIDFIKVDTDGYDWECLMSLETILDDVAGYLYWENQLDQGNKSQREGYQRLAKYLEGAGYTSFFCFDNFGNYLAHGGIDFLLEINHYLARMNDQKTARTFYYVDVLACRKDKVDIVKAAIHKYYN